MAYSLEGCSAYQIKSIQDKEVIIFDSHNMALPAWGTIRQKYDSPPHLISFDTHADTRAAFAREIMKEYSVYDELSCKRFKKEFLSFYSCDAANFVFEDAFRLAIELVAHDEHIMVADYYDYINGYTVFCGLSEDDANWYQRDDRLSGQNATYYTKYKILGMEEEDIQALCSTPFILDFDLDYFTHPSIINFEFYKKVGELVRHAVAITIAKEPEYFDREKTDKIFSNDQALGMLLNLIAQELKKKI